MPRKPSTVADLHAQLDALALDDQALNDDKRRRVDLLSAAAKLDRAADRLDRAQYCPSTAAALRQHAAAVRTAAAELVGDERDRDDRD